MLHARNVEHYGYKVCGPRLQNPEWPKTFGDNEYIITPDLFPQKPANPFATPRQQSAINHALSRQRQEARKRKRT